MFKLNPNSHLTERVICSFIHQIDILCIFSASHYCNDTSFLLLGFSHSSVGKESTSNARDPGLIPGSGRSPGEGISYPLQYSGLENSCGQRSLVGYSPWGYKEWDMTKHTAQPLLRRPKSKDTRVLLSNGIVFVYNLLCILLFTLNHLQITSNT